jgi:serum/glucocorticoid-regulated kinase 2
MDPEAQEGVSDEDQLSVDNSCEDHTHGELTSWAARTGEIVLPKVQLSDFEMVCVLGIGSRGKVLLARHTNSSAPYAVKVMSKRRVLEHQEIQRAFSEQAVLRRMADEGEVNPFVVKLWWSFHDQNNLYLVMVRGARLALLVYARLLSWLIVPYLRQDFHPGGDLRTLLETRGSLGCDLSRFYAAQIVDGIEGLHAAGVIHRNLKPEHVLIDEEGNIVICGFGKSKEFQRSAAQGRSQSNDTDTTDSLCGTAEYFAPEVIKGLPYSYGIDWWSFGTIMYEILTGTVSISLFSFSRDESSSILCVPGTETIRCGQHVRHV